MKNIFGYLVALCAGVLILGAGAHVINIWYRTFILGAYYAHATIFLNAIGILVPVIAIFFTVVGLIQCWKLRNAF